MKHDSLGDAASIISQWLSQMADSAWDPWPDYVMDDDEEESMVAIVDPTMDEKLQTEKFTYRGKTDAQGSFHVYGTLTYDNGDVVTSEFKHGVKHGDAVVICPRKNIARLVGTYKHDRLQGRGKVVTDETEVTDCFFKNGCMHGPARRFVMKKFREFRQQLDFVGFYKGGKPHGVCWKYQEGGGFLVGQVDPLNGEFTGESIAFLYPDLKTAFIGAFLNGKMTAAKATTVAVAQIGKDHMLFLDFVEPSCDAPTVRFSKSTKTCIGDQPLVSDPYEESLVEVRDSNVPGGGDGLFARVDLPKGTIAAFYNGVRLAYRLGGPKEDWTSSGYKIYINADYESGERMDIPAEYISLSSYCASLGHKLNHSFRPNCEEWFFEHPRFGTVPCERTKEDVKAGAELFLDYEYDPYNCPDWFRDQLVAFKQSMSEEEEAALSPKYARFQP